MVWLQSSRGKPKVLACFFLPARNTRRMSASTPLMGLARLVRLGGFHFFDQVSKHAIYRFLSVPVGIWMLHLSGVLRPDFPISSNFEVSMARKSARGHGKSPITPPRNASFGPFLAGGVCHGSMPSPTSDKVIDC